MQQCPGASYGENRTSAAVRQISMFARSLSRVRGREHLRIECIQDLVHQVPHVILPGDRNGHEHRACGCLTS